MPHVSCTNVAHVVRARVQAVEDGRFLLVRGAGCPRVDGTYRLRPELSQLTPPSPPSGGVVSAAAAAAVMRPVWVNDETFAKVFWARGRWHVGDTTGNRHWYFSEELQL